MKNIKLNFKNQKSYTRQGEEVYYDKLARKLLQDVDENDCYTEEEFWKNIREMEIEEFGMCLEHNLYQKSVQRYC